MTPSVNDPVVSSASSRRREIVTSAAGLFVRYGFRKTSMDDIARVSKLSRQGLYLHFRNKEDAFRAVIEHIAEITLRALRTALEDDGRDLDERLLAGFASMTEAAVGAADARDLQELFGAARELAGDIVQQLDDQIVVTLAGTLKQARRSRERGEPSPRALAELLYVTSYGLQHRGHSGNDYLSRMRVAIRVVCKSEGL
ncbi:MAG: TetR/AcrR family transcriptional regulator [Polyangiaceae bacterium]